ncbi:MAG: type II toxin-antitoxin system HicA family toxin [Patescibacteria group bacterium]
MPKLYSSKQIIRTLQSKGFVFVSQKGSHVKFHKIGRQTLTVIVPTNKKEIPLGTFKSILRQSGLSEENFNY